MIVTVNTRTGDIAHQLEMYYHWQGPEDAPKVVWLAGLGQDHLAWGLQMAFFAKHFRCLLIDNRDVGRTANVERDYDGRDMAHDLVGLLNALDVPRISVVGLSLGGVIAQEFALAYPERLEKLVLLSTFPGGDTWLAALTQSWATQYAALTPQDFIKAVSPWLYTWRIYQNRPAFLEVLAQRRATNPRPQSQAAYTRQCQVSIKHNALERLAQIVSPTLVVVGQEDILTPLRHAQTLAQLISNAELAVIPAAGHGGSVEIPQPFNEVMFDFLSKTNS